MNDLPSEASIYTRAKFCSNLFTAKGGLEKKKIKRVKVIKYKGHYTCKICCFVSHLQLCAKYCWNSCSGVEGLGKLDMCLWNTDAPGGNKVKIWQKSQRPTFWPCPTPGACDVSEMWGTLRWTCSPSLVIVSSPKLEILCFVWKRDGITDRWTDRQSDY